VTSHPNDPVVPLQMPEMGRAPGLEPSLAPSGPSSLAERRGTGPAGALQVPRAQNRLGQEASLRFDFARWGRRRTAKRPTFGAGSLASRTAQFVSLIGRSLAGRRALGQRSLLVVGGAPFPVRPPDEYLPLAPERASFKVSPTPAERRAREWERLEQKMARSVAPKLAGRQPLGLPRAVSRASQSRVGRQTGPTGAARRMARQPVFVANPKDVTATGPMLASGEVQRGPHVSPPTRREARRGKGSGDEGPAHNVRGLGHRDGGQPEPWLPPRPYGSGQPGQDRQLRVMAGRVRQTPSLSAPFLGRWPLLATAANGGALKALGTLRPKALGFEPIGAMSLSRTSLPPWQASATRERMSHAGRLSAATARQPAPVLAERPGPARLGPKAERAMRPSAGPSAPSYFSPSGAPHGRPSGQGAVQAGATSRKGFPPAGLGAALPAWALPATRARASSQIWPTGTQGAPRAPTAGSTLERFPRGGASALRARAVEPVRRALSSNGAPRVTGVRHQTGPAGSPRRRAAGAPAWAPVPRAAAARAPAWAPVPRACVARLTAVRAVRDAVQRAIASEGEYRATAGNGKYGARDAAPAAAARGAIGPVQAVAQPSTANQVLQRVGAGVLRPVGAGPVLGFVAFPGLGRSDGPGWSAPTAPRPLHPRLPGSELWQRADVPALASLSPLGAVGAAPARSKALVPRASQPGPPASAPAPVASRSRRGRWSEGPVPVASQRGRQAPYAPRPPNERSSTATIARYANRGLPAHREVRAAAPMSTFRPQALFTTAPGGQAAPPATPALRARAIGPSGKEMALPDAYQVGTTPLPSAPAKTSRLVQSPRPRTTMASTPPGATRFSAVAFERHVDDATELPSGLAGVPGPPNFRGVGRGPSRQVYRRVLATGPVVTLARKQLLSSLKPPRRLAAHQAFVPQPARAEAASGSAKGAALGNKPGVPSRPSSAILPYWLGRLQAASSFEEPAELGRAGQFVQRAGQFVQRADKVVQRQVTGAGSSSRFDDLPVRHHGSPSHAVHSIFTFGTAGLPVAQAARVAAPSRGQPRVGETALGNYEAVSGRASNGQERFGSASQERFRNSVQGRLGSSNQGRPRSIGSRVAGPPRNEIGPTPASSRLPIVQRQSAVGGSTGRRLPALLQGGQELVRAKPNQAASPIAVPSNPTAVAGAAVARVPRGPAISEYLDSLSEALSDLRTAQLRRRGLLLNPEVF